MFCGFTLGASAGGFAASWMIPAYGGGSVFILGGLMPIALAVALRWSPESIRFQSALGRGVQLRARCLVSATSHGLDDAAALSWLIFATGMFLAGALTSMPVLTAAYYPTQARASGVAWMLGIGHFGGVVGALAGGPLLNAGLGMSHIWRCWPSRRSSRQQR